MSTELWNGLTKEESEEVSRACSTDGYLMIDPRLKNENYGTRKHLLIFSSCIADQMFLYLGRLRPEITAQFYIHRLQIQRVRISHPVIIPVLLRSLFSKLDVIFWNQLSQKHEPWSTSSMLTMLNKTALALTFTNPSCACFAPYTVGFGESPIVRYLAEGLSPPEIWIKFKEGSFDPLFEQRFRDQTMRLIGLDQSRDSGLGEFVVDHHKTHKMFYNHNHPSFHIVAHLCEQLIGKMGFQTKDNDFCLSLDPDTGGFGITGIPETDYEWKHYGFTYPKKWPVTRRGSVDQHFQSEIQEIIKRRSGSNNPDYYGDDGEDQM